MALLRQSLVYQRVCNNGNKRNKTWYKKTEKSVFERLSPVRAINRLDRPMVPGI